jgi:hypothetical protein
MFQRTFPRAKLGLPCSKGVHAHQHLFSKYRNCPAAWFCPNHKEMRQARLVGKGVQRLAFQAELLHPVIQPGESFESSKVGEKCRRAAKSYPQDIATS